MAIFQKRSVKSFGGEKKQDMPEGLWRKCPGCGAMLHQIEQEENLNVCPKCSHHFTMTAMDRIGCTVDDGSFEEIDANLETVDPLGFLDYSNKIKAYQERTGLKDAIITGKAKIDGMPITIGVMDFRFLGASMGSVVGEKITRAIELATKERIPVILFSASGGARMHEGILSLMQMSKTCAALARHHQKGLAYISVLTHPTTGGVTASFSTVGDIIIAEPKCMIGFAGPRVVKETTHQNLPPGFQTAEFMMEHGLIDMIVERKDMRNRLAELLGYVQSKVARVAS
ncbi:MAG: acetyl-CoA carboxylase carboxyl transferase subunit beta [Verrucomicrobiales bacterium]|jgi:acetyl-CoA carboxylase carboxyl transferase subunit beta